MPTANSSIKMKFKEHLPEYLVLFLSIVFATLVTFDLQLNYPHWEMYTYIEHFAMDTQPEFNFTNDIQGLIRPELDGLASRPRFFSWYVSVINAKLRFLLFKYSPIPHPTINLTWLLTLFLLPLYFFKFICLMTKGHRPAALLSTATLLCSIGYISNLTIYFHPGKPVSLFAVVVCFYYLAKMQFLDQQNQLTRKHFYFLFTLICLSLFWDELYFVFFLTAPLFFFNFLKKYQKEFLVVVLRSALVFGLVTFLIVPTLSKKPFDFLNFALFSNTKLLSGNTPHFGQNIFEMFAAYTSPIEFIYPAPNSFEWGTIFGLRALPMWITVILFLTPFIFYFRNRNFKINLIYLQCFTAAFIYFIFQELALTRTNGQLICGGYYWGVIFAFFFNLLFAIWVTTNNHRFWRYTSIALALSICGFGSLNSVNSSKMTMRHNHNLYPNLANLKLGDYGDFDYKSLVEIWKHRKNHEKVRELLKGKPKNMAWIYYESRKHTLKPHRD